jgi:PAS domain S-box-containing protein
MDQVRILVVDDQETMRRTVRSLLSSRTEWLVCGEAADGFEAVKKTKSLRPDLVLMDVSMPRMDGIEAARIIRRETPETEVIFISQYDSVWASKAPDIYGRGYLYKGDLALALHPTIDRMMRSAKDSAPLEAAPERTSRLLTAIVDSSDDAIVSKNLDGTITSWNKGAERMFGYTAEEAVGQHITLIVPKERRDEEANILERLQRGERVDHFETLRVSKDDRLIDVSLTISPVKDALGQVVGASKVARDITERKRNEQALAERAQLLDLSSDAIFVRDLADRIIYWNRSASELYGYSREEAMGRVTHELLQTTFPEPLERINERFHRDKRWSGELIHRHKDGTLVVVLSRWTLDMDSRGNRKCVLETNNDITRLKQNEKALLESGERLQRLAEGLETQVRLRTQELERRNIEVLQQSEQLRRLSNRLLQIQDDERRHIARELHDSVGQIVAALGMSLAFMAERGQVDPVLVKASQEGRELVEQLGKEIRTMSYLLHPPLLDESGLLGALRWYIEGVSQRSGIAIELVTSESFGRLPNEMELTVFRIVQECLTNIHRHSGSKTATIRLSHNADCVSLEIQDAGKGISADRLGEIRERSGIGIMGMRERVRQFQGTINIESNGRGTTILVSLPLPITSTTKPQDMTQDTGVPG